MPTSLITGANGFAGSHMAEHLLDRSHRVICLVRKTSDLSNLKGLNVELRYGDVTDVKSLHLALKGAEYVFHFAGKTKAFSEDEYMYINGQGTANVAEACCNDDLSIKMLVYISSLAAAGPQQSELSIDERMPPRPITAYGRSKLAGEAFIRQICAGKIRWCIVRPTGVYGPRDKDILKYFKMVNRGWKVLVSGHDRKVSLIHAQDLAQLCYRAATRSPNGELYMASDGESYTWEQLTDKIARVMGKKTTRISVPLWVTKTAAVLSEIRGSLTGKLVTLNREKLMELTAQGWAVDIAKAEDKLGYFTEYPILEGVKETVRWYRKNGWL